MYQNLHRLLPSRTDLETVGLPYLLGNIQAGKSKKELWIFAVGLEVSATASTYLKEHREGKNGEKILVPVRFFRESVPGNEETTERRQEQKPKAPLLVQ